ncbi:MAG TPA: PTS sugar transporter subunit IIA [Candidatus Kapabacteria bacterium]|jgi:fructose-specific phosphotransferase system IIA component|nr:PTS sugar transporter subunit IIA [Candidatus Kapabacteria bacterium]HOV92029.1 PTS sugar transporter subunit IIA [Candidatus Kapabacteria bacterium]
MDLIDILNKNSISVHSSLKNKEEIINELIDLAEFSGKIIDKNQVIKDVFDREKVLSTGIGKNIALPHAKTKGVSDFCSALITLSEPVDFDSLDGDPIKLAFLLIGPENNVGMNLKLLSRISRILNNESYRNKLIEFDSADEILEFLKEVQNF